MTDAPARSRFYVTAAIDYVNGAPHLGHAYEKIGCDVVARWRRLCGDDVRFVIGSDEHSQSVLRAATASGLDPDAFCQRQIAVFQAVFEQLDVSHTAYVRTSSEANRHSTDEFMRRLHEGGHIFKAPYRAWFCPSCERFYTEKELVDGRCPIHDRPVEWVEEENWFFRLSAFAEQLLRLIEERPDFLTPEVRRNEILAVLRSGLEDISISRAFSTWGFPVPFDPGQVVYVWFDALLSYVTGIGFATEASEFSDFWPADVHVIGKDITRFHAVMWPAMLIAAGLPLPRRIHVHGFLTLGGRKLSKTSGVRIDPLELVTHLGSDGTRYVFLAEVGFDRDGDIAMEAAVDRFNADLANDYGNLVSRSEKMLARYFGGLVPEPGRREDGDAVLRQAAARAAADHAAAMARIDLGGAIAAAQRLVARANLYVDEAKPWVLHKSGDARLATVLRELLEAVRVATILLHPVIPRATRRVADDLGIALDGGAGAAASRWGGLDTGARIGVGDILFPRLDRDGVVAALLGDAQG